MRAHELTGDAAVTTGWLTGPVAITGATGHVGGFVRARLAETSNEVRPVGRHDDLTSALEGADAVIHLAGALQVTGGNTYEAANVTTVRRTVAALAGSRPRRIVFLSYVGADADSDNAYLRAKGDAERLIRESGREAVVVRSTFIYGPPDDPGPGATPFISRDRKPVSMIGSGRQRYAPAYVGDVSEALVRFALDPASPTGVFSLAGPDELTADEFADALSGFAARKRHLPHRFARALARILPSLSPALVDVLAADSLPDAPAAPAALGMPLHSLAGVYGGDGVSAPA